MPKQKEIQLSLFQLNPRDAGKSQVDRQVGGLAELQIMNFKGIQNISVSFDPITLLVGANNSGKSTILQAIRLFFYCIEKCGFSFDDKTIYMKKQVMPFSNFGLIPAHDIRELILNGITPSDKKRGIFLRGRLYSGQEFEFTIYSAYSTLLVILPRTPNVMSKKDFDFASRSPLYVPGFFGVVNKEFLSTNQRIEELLGTGHHNEVLRNLILRLDEKSFQALSSLLGSEFGVKLQGMHDDDLNKIEFLKASYREDLLRIPLDIISAGSGFLQVLQILTHALQSPSPVLLLDEPDAHMHTQLQEHFINLLRTFAEERKMQIIMASHSEPFLRTMQLSEIRLIDRKTNRSDKFTDPIALKADLNSNGVWPNEPELTEALRTKRILLCEAEPDSKLFSCLASFHTKDWGKFERQYQVITTQGANDNIVERMQAIVEILNTLLNGNVYAAYLRDRDLMCDEHKHQAEQTAKTHKLNLVITERRNRESYLIEPKIIEAAVLSFGDKVPKEWRDFGTISNLVHQWILEYCNSQIDELPVKIIEYNQHWIRSQTSDESERRKLDTKVQTFIREHWHDKLKVKEIPWKLVDGLGALKMIRQRIQEKGIVLTEQVLLSYANVVPITSDFKSLIEIIGSWH
jgi:predicted ATPase